MYGKHDLPLKIEKEEFSLSFERENGGVAYHRSCFGETAVKTIYMKKGKVLLNPVEPTNKPKSITPYLLVEFENPIIVEPQSERTVFVTFPVEIGVYIIAEDKSRIIDIFSLAKQKYTLYGEPTSGLICKYWKSRVHPKPPGADPLKEGVIELALSNPNPDWTEIGRAVFNAYGMKIFYSKEKTAMKARMKLMDNTTAETSFEESSFKRDMTKSIEIYTTSKLAITSTKFLMEHGL